jgi:hypothetical protein
MMPLGFSELNSISENNQNKRKHKRKTIKKRQQNRKVDTFLKSMNSKLENFETNEKEDKETDMSTKKSIDKIYSDDFEDNESDLGEPINKLDEESLNDNAKDDPMFWDKNKLEKFGLLKEGLRQHERYQNEQMNQLHNNAQGAYLSIAKKVPYYSKLSNSQELSGSHDELMRKLNYVVHMLEEQKDEKTDNVTEELVLYMFLGVFVIFIVDSFARVTKYTR